ncbi:MAG: nucleotide exchange factor GrpE [Gemmatimonadales bacterium]|nr:MAG: nucleotide exchange factor GrpE [Gemmatimonadales bacterium]
MNEDQDAVDQTPPSEGTEAHADPAPSDEGEVAGEGAQGVPFEPELSAVRRLEEQLQDSQDKWLRLAAEFDNFRKRVAKERLELGDRAQAALVMRLLDVLDDLDRLAEQDLSATGRDVLHEALVLVDRKLRKELAAAGLERVDPIGTHFDPTLHEAVAVLPPPTEEQEHKVSALFQAGYTFKGTLVRPARVQVYAGDQD